MWRSMCVCVVAEEEEVIGTERLTCCDEGLT